MERLTGIWEFLRFYVGGMALVEQGIICVAFSVEDAPGAGVLMTISGFQESRPVGGGL